MYHSSVATSAAGTAAALPFTGLNLVWFVIAAFALCFLVSVGDYVTPAFVGGTISMVGSNIQDMFGRALNPPLGAATSFIMLFASFVIVLAVSAAIKAWRPR